jgi:hypothetical protein
MKKTMLRTRRNPFFVAWLLPVLCLIIIDGAAGDSAAETATLVLTGDAAPDGNGTFVDLGIPVLNASGEVAFVAGLTGTQNPSTDTGGIYFVDAQSIIQLVRTGEPAPDGNGVFSYFAQDFNNQQRVALNDEGSVAFTASLSGTAGGSTDNVGQFGASVIDGVTEFVRISDSAPDGNGEFVLYGPFTPPTGWPLGLDNLGQASFYGVFEGSIGGTSDNHGVFRSDGMTLSQLARGGEAVPGGVETFESIFPQLGSNLAGQVAMHATLPFDLQDPTGDGSFDDLERIYVSTGTILEEFVRTGTPLPGGDGTLSAMLAEPPRISEAGTVLFFGVSNDTDNHLADGIRLLLTDGVTLIQIVHLNELGPEGGDFRFDQFFGADSNFSNEVAFSASLHRNAVPPDNRTSGIFMTAPGGIVQLVAQGDPAPDGNGTFGPLTGSVLMNNSGEIVFSASLEGTADPNGFDTSGLFVVDANSNVQEVARGGQSLAGSTIAFAMHVGFLGEPNAFPGNTDLAQAGMNGINDAGQVVFNAVLLDGRSGIFVWPVPEPSGGVLALAALATVWAIRVRGVRVA